MQFPTLNTERLLLEEIEMEHAPALYENFSNPTLLEYYGSEPMTDISQAEQMVRHFKSDFETKRGIRWAIILEEERRFVGTIGLNHLSLGMKRAEIGYEIHPHYWRSGITSEALKAVVTYTFVKLGLNRIGAVTFLDNHASIGLLQKSGFQKEGILRSYLYQNGKSYDGLLFSRLREEWMIDE